MSPLSDGRPKKPITTVLGLNTSVAFYLIIRRCSQSQISLSRYCFFCFTSALNKASGKKQMGKHGNVKEMKKLRGKDYLTKDCIDPITFDGNLL